MWVFFGNYNENFLVYGMCVYVCMCACMDVYIRVCMDCCIVSLA